MKFHFSSRHVQDNIACAIKYELLGITANAIKKKIVLSFMSNPSI